MKNLMEKISESFSELFAGIAQAFASPVSADTNKQTVTWVNSAGQVISASRASQEQLEKIAQAHIDSFAILAEGNSATPEKRLATAKTVAAQFGNLAARVRVVEDIENGGGRYRFTVRLQPDAPRTLV